MTPVDRRVAWVESPLQLLNAIEYAAASRSPLVICPRAGVAQLDATVAAVRAALPEGVTVVAPRPSPVGGPFATARRQLAGDVFSGQFRALAAARVSDLVVVDDGSAALYLADALTGRAALRRMGQREPMVHRVLGTAALRRLRHAVRDGRLELFTAYADASAVVAVGDAGARISRNAYTWTRNQSLDGLPALRAFVVLGTALVVDGYIDRDHHARWLRDVAREQPVSYLPHRREDGATLARLRAIPGVEVVETGLPVELVLGGAGVPHRVLTLPSSAVVTLGRIVGDSVHVAPIPEQWWTDRADEALRRTLANLETRSSDG